jgi:hypothetical protein
VLCHLTCPSGDNDRGQKCLMSPEHPLFSVIKPACSVNYWLYIDFTGFLIYAENMAILLDASAIMAVIAKEPEGATVVRLTMGETIVSPSVVPFEIANALTRMMKKKIINSEDEMIKVFQQFKRIHIKIALSDDVIIKIKIVINYLP